MAAPRTAMDVAAFLRDLGLERYIEAFQDQDVDAEILPKLTADALIAAFSEPLRYPQSRRRCAPRLVEAGLISGRRRSLLASGPHRSGTG